MDIDKNTWQHPFLYTHLFSNNGCSFTITANFLEEEDMARKRKELKSGNNPMANMQSHMQKLHDQIA